MENTDIRSIRLETGIQLIGEVTSENRSSIYMKNPAEVITTTMSHPLTGEKKDVIVLQLWTEFTEDNTIRLRKVPIIQNANPTTDLLKLYNSLIKRKSKKNDEIPPPESLKDLGTTDDRAEARKELENLMEMLKKIESGDVGKDSSPPPPMINPFDMIHLNLTMNPHLFEKYFADNLPGMSNFDEDDIDDWVEEEYEDEIRKWEESNGSNSDEVDHGPNFNDWPKTREDWF